MWEQFKLNVAQDETFGARLDRESQNVIKKNRHYVKSVAEACLVCAQGGIALRGHEETMKDSTKNPGNFRALVRLLSRHDEVVKQCLAEGA